MTIVNLSCSSKAYLKFYKLLFYHFSEKLKIRKKYGNLHFAKKKNEKHSSSSERQTVNTKIPRTTKKNNKL